MGRVLGVLVVLAILLAPGSSGAIPTSVPLLAKKAPTPGGHHDPPPHDLTVTPGPPSSQSTHGWSIPEPATGALFGAGLLALGVLIARRRR